MTKSEFSTFHAAQFQFHKIQQQQSQKLTFQHAYLVIFLKFNPSCDLLTANWGLGYSLWSNRRKSPQLIHKRQK